MTKRLYTTVEFAMNPVFHNMKPFRGLLTLSGILYAVMTFCALGLPYIMSKIIDVGIRNGDLAYIGIYSAVMVILGLINLGAGVWVARVNSRISAGYSRRLREETFDKVNTLSFEEFSKMGTSGLLTRSSDDIDVMSDVAGQMVYALVTVPLMLIGGVVMSLLGDWVLALILLAATPLILAVVWFVTRKMGALWDKADKHIDVQNRVIRERLKGIRVIRAFDREETEYKRSEHATRTMADNIIKANVYSGAINPVASILLNLAVVLILYAGAFRIFDGVTQAGDVVAVIQYVSITANALLVMSWTFALFPRIMVCSRRINELLRLPGADPGQAGEKLKGSLRLEHVTFGYEGAEAPVLKDVSMEVEAGETVGIIGGTGSGKSTLIKLIAAFYPFEGTIELGGKDYRQLTPATVRDNVSLAGQKSMIFEGTAAENLKADGRYSDEEMKAAARIAQVDFLEDREGFETVFTQAGGNLSGGQKQRVSIARALLKRASVYVFDDSFSALDFLTETKLRKGLNEYLAGKTQLIVTQRAATAMRCDKIYVLDKGRVAGSGTHQTLMASCPVYAEIYRSQMGGQP